MTTPTKAAGHAMLARIGLPPRGLSRLQAAAYVGVGVVHFDRLVATGQMPRAVHMGERVVWDRQQLDAAFDAMSHGAASEAVVRDEWSAA